MLAGYDRGLNWVFRHQLLTLVEHHRADRAHRISLSRSSRKAFSRNRTPAFCSASPGEAGHSSTRWPSCRIRFRKSSCRIRPFRHGRLCRLDRRQFQRKHRPHVHPAQAIRSAAGDRAGDAAAAAQGGASDRRQILHAGRAGHDVGGRLEQAQYQYTLTDTNSDELNHWAPIFLVEDASDENSDRRGLRPADRLAGNHDRGRSRRRVDLGVTLSAVDAALYAAFGQQQVATIYLPTQQAKVILEVQPKFQIGPTALSRIYVAGDATARRCRFRRWRTNATRWSR